MDRIFGILFVLTGIFALAGGFYTWGDGSIFSQTELLHVLIPWADILLTAPISIAGGVGILRNSRWGFLIGLVCSDIYIFGSVLVFITIIWNNNYSIFLILPSGSGLAIGVGYIVYRIRVL